MVITSAWVGGICGALGMYLVAFFFGVVMSMQKLTTEDIQHLGVWILLSGASIALFFSFFYFRRLKALRKIYFPESSWLSS